MLKENIKCTECGQYYDAHLNKCPNCEKSKRTLSNFLLENHECVLPPFIQMLLFLLGCFGISIISTFWSSIYIHHFSISLGVTKHFLIANIDNFPLVNFTINQATFVCLFILFSFILISQYKTIFEHLSKWKNYIKGVGFGVALILANLIIGMFTSSLTTDVNDNQKTLISMIQVEPSISLMIFGIIGPICEELTYRLGLFSFVERFQKPWLSYLITSFLFAFIHFNFASTNLINEFINLPSYVIAGLLLSFAYKKGGLPASIIAHVMNNALSILMIIFGNN